MKLLVICNPVSGHGRAKRIFPKIEEYLEHKGNRYTLILTEYPGHAAEIARETCLEGFSGIVAVGGDGTLFEVLNGYRKNTSPARIPIGVVPTGTGNSVARELEIELSDWPSAIDIVLDNQPKKIDIACVRTNEDVYYFVNILGIGFAANVTARAHSLKTFGNVAYTLGVFLEAVSLQPASFDINIDGKSIERSAIFVEVSNTRYTANFFMAPAARIDDGLLDITVLNKVSRRKLIQYFPKIFTGEHVALEEVETFQARNIRIASNRPQRVSPDGELRGATPVEIECLPQAIEMFWR